MRYTRFHRAIAVLQRQEQRAWSICFTNEIEVEALDRLREAYRDAGQTPPSFTAMVIKAIALAIAELRPRYPELSSTLAGLPGLRWIHVYDRQSAGLAIAREEADGRDVVFNTVLEDPDRAPLGELTRRLQEASQRPVEELADVRQCRRVFNLPAPIQWLLLTVGGLIPRARQQFRGTFALTTVGKFGVDCQLTLPQTACLHFGFGAIRSRPVVHGEQVVPARTLFLTVSFDRRLLNGRPVALLMERTRQVLQTAEFHEEIPAVGLDRTDVPANAPEAETPGGTARNGDRP